MIPLEEYLGKLVSSLSRARVLADMESAKIAQLYASDNLLKHFSIPRMRLIDVELTIPVAICNLAMEPKRKIIFIEKKRIADLTYSTTLKSLNLKFLPKTISKDFEIEVNRHIDALTSQINNDNYVQKILEYASNISKHVPRLIESTFSKDSLLSIDLELIKTSIISKLKEALEKEITFEIDGSQLANLNVIAETDKLKEKNINTLLMIKVKVSEESMTWERIDDGNGNIINKLLPE